MTITTIELLELLKRWQRARIVHEKAQDEAQRTYRELAAVETELAKAQLQEPT